MAGPATAQSQGAAEPTFTPEQLAFDAADTNGDGLISEGEFTRDAARAFATLDKNGDSQLTPDEFGSQYDAARFARIDANHDGKLSFPEVMTYKLRAFHNADKNNDGLLTFDEMRDEVAREEGATP